MSNTLYQKACTVVGISMLPMAAVVGFLATAAVLPIPQPVVGVIRAMEPASEVIELPNVITLSTIEITGAVKRTAYVAPRPVPELKCTSVWHNSAVGGQYRTCEYGAK